MKIFLISVPLILGFAPVLALSEGGDFKDNGSYFGRVPNRFSAMEDEEGREVDFHAKDFSSGRSPASVKPRLDEAAEPTRVEREIAHEEKEADAAENAGYTATTPSGTGGKSLEQKVYERPSRSRYSSEEDGDGVRTSPSEFRGRKIASFRDSGSGSTEIVSDDTRLKDPFAGADAMTRRRGVQEVSVIANDLGFYPKTFFVSKNIPVRMYVTGATKNSTCLMMDAFNVRKQLKMNKVEEITFVPNQAGTYRFYCPVNNSDGTMVVKELSP